jgi:hypothetical protein
MKRVLSVLGTIGVLASGLAVGGTFTGCGPSGSGGDTGTGGATGAGGKAQNDDGFTGSGGTNASGGITGTDSGGNGSGGIGAGGIGTGGIVSIDASGTGGTAGRGGSGGAAIDGSTGRPDAIVGTGGAAGASSTGGATGTGGMGTAVCSDLQANGPVVRDISNMTSPAAGGYNGGVILDGTYELTNILEYAGPGGTLGIDYGTKQRTIRISNGGTKIDLIWISVPKSSTVSPSTTNASGTISLASPTMTITLMCGVIATFSYYYTVASETELALYFWDSTGSSETVFIYMLKTSGSMDGGSAGDSGSRG